MILLRFINKYAIYTLSAEFIVVVWFDSVVKAK
jgi:hypothetical protein